MQEHDDDLFESALKIAERAVKQAAPEPTLPPVTVRIEPGSTAVNVGTVHIGSQTIHQTAQPTKPKTS